jgi:hypothetical protein
MILKIDLYMYAVALDYILLHRVKNLMISVGGQYGNIFHGNGNTLVFEYNSNQFPVTSAVVEDFPASLLPLKSYTRAI